MTSARIYPYAELCVTSNFTFLTGASHPEELVTRATELGLAAIALTDRNSVAGVVRALIGVRLLAKGVGGALGNVIDRLVHGHVIDFIQWYWRGHYWPAFNLADSAITVGVVMMLWGQLFGPAASDPPRPGAPS